MGPTCGQVAQSWEPSRAEVGAKWVQVGLKLGSSWPKIETAHSDDFAPICTMDFLGDTVPGCYMYGILLLLPSKSGQYTSPTWDSKNLASKSTKQAIPYING